MIISELYTRNTNLRILSLNNNMIGNKGCLILAEYIPKLIHLEILYLSTNISYNLTRK